MANHKSILIRIDSIAYGSADDLVAKLTQKIRKKVAADPCVETILFRMSEESGDSAVFLPWLQKLLFAVRSHHPGIKFFLICDSWFRPQLLHEKLSGICEILYLDWFLLSVYYRLIMNNESPVVSHWNPKSHSILFLAGRAQKINRIRLLYKLLKTDVSNCLNFSFLVKQGHKQQCRSLLPDLSDNEFEWLMAHERQVDEFGASWNHTCPTPPGIAYQEKIYSSALFQIIAETDFDRPFIYPWITEKTWLSIINHRPFIIAGEYHTCDRLESMGFQTFRDFLAIPNYDNPDEPNFLRYGSLSTTQGSIMTSTQIEDWQNFYSIKRESSWPLTCKFEHIDTLPGEAAKTLLATYQIPIEGVDDLRLDAIVQNTLFWRTNIGKYQNQISEATNHNHTRFLSLGEQNCLRLQNFLVNNQIDCALCELMQIEQTEWT